MSDELRLWAVRGATKVERNDPEEVLQRTEELMRELIARNDLEADRIVSCIFTATHDLNAEFPAAAARKQEVCQVGAHDQQQRSDRRH